MQTLTFKTRINASPEKIWKVLWEDATYRKWTNVFSEGSHAVSDWKEGSRVLFLGPDGGGMFSEIAKLVPNEYIAFRHLGMMKDGKEEPETEETKSWAGAMETYTLKSDGSSTELTATVDIVEQHADHFQDAFPKGLNIVKELSEQA
jgi:uncharacterized protein YndB with AHSA1/START domain